jgi:hypothetical protein
MPNPIRAIVIRPDAQLEITAVDATHSSLETAEAMMRQALPDQQGRQTDWLTIRHPR